MRVRRQQIFIDNAIVTAVDAVTAQDFIREARVRRQVLYAGIMKLMRADFASVGPTTGRAEVLDALVKLIRGFAK